MPFCFDVFCLQLHDKNCVLIRQQKIVVQFINDRLTYSIYILFQHII